MTCNNTPHGIKELIREAIEEIFLDEDEYAPFNSLNDKVEKLLNVQRYEERLSLARATLDKFDDYMKNVDKLNQMVNELKGVVSMARASIAERKKTDNKSDESKPF
jgi:cobalamin biosynthesis Co2+ chelatase CbiK